MHTLCYVVATTFIILIFAANTAFSGFPVLISVMSKDGFMPRQLSMRGNLPSYGIGIILLSAASILLIIAFKADVGALIGLYAIGVFISFTLSQTGMFIHWRKSGGKGWKGKAAINGLGAAVTAPVVVIIAVTKFAQGAWIVVCTIPLQLKYIDGDKKRAPGTKRGRGGRKGSNLKGRIKTGAANCQPKRKLRVDNWRPFYYHRVIARRGRPIWKKPENPKS